MMDNSTKAENPVNQIASMLQEETPELLAETVKPEEVTEVDTKVEEPQDVSQPAEELEEETPDKVYFNDVLNDIDIDINDAYEMSLKMPNDESMTLGELKNFAIDNKDIESVKADLKQRELDLQAQAEQAQSAPKVSNELMQARAQVLAIHESYNAQNWDAIRQTNPAEWSALQTEYQQKFNAAKSQEAAAESQANTQIEQARTYQQERLFEFMPELKDEKARQAAALQVQNMTSDFGIPKNHLESVDNANVMKMLITLSKMYSAKDTVKTKMQDNTPKSSSPSAAQRIPSTRKQALKRLTDKAKSTGQRRDQINAVNALLG